MNRIPYLGKHMQRLNPEERARKRFWLLLPLGYLSLGFAIGSFLHCERNALKGYPEASQNPYRGHGVRAQALSEGVSREWVGRTRAGEPIRKNERGEISFVWYGHENTKGLRESLNSPLHHRR